MSTLTLKTVELLEQLVASYRQAELAFRRAAARIQPDRLQALLNNYAQMRSQLAGELEGALNRSRRTIEPHWDRCPIEFSPESGGGDVGLALAECSWYDDQCLNQFQVILRHELSQPLRRIINRQRAAVLSDYERLCNLIRSLTPPAMAPTGG